MDKPLISLCIPTNGVVEWMFPVLDSIYAQGVDEELFEVVVTDNGSNEDFYSRMTAYRDAHSNIVYAKTNAMPFLNEIEAYKRASGAFIKFLNHRTMLIPGALPIFIDFVEQNREQKPVVYFSNGMLNMPQKVSRYDSFDSYVANLSYWSSWSTGMGFWKEDFDSIPEDTVFNELFPHTTVLFHVRDRSSYILDNRVLLEELPTGTIPKGRYDLFYAFAVEYPGIICDLLRSGSITTQTFLKVKDENLDFVAQLYFDYVLRKNPCSYDLSSYERSIQVYYSPSAANKKLRKLALSRLKGKLHLGS
ncbi:MAG: hypothetical protein IJX67_06450 [Oscillospiraceae bacterium]|nr:hypothetical protein [Oscillospiraceae bacterium]